MGRKRTILSRLPFLGSLAFCKKILTYFVVTQLQELEMENSLLKKDLGVIRKSVADQNPEVSKTNLMGKWSLIIII